MAIYDLELQEKDSKGKWIKRKTIITNISSTVDRFLFNKEMDEKDGFTNIRIHKEKTPTGFRVTKYSGERGNERFIAKHRGHYKERERQAKAKAKAKNKKK